MTGYEPNVWREFLKKHDDVETYNRIKCEVCGDTGKRPVPHQEPFEE